ncbi:MKK3, partial [Symbiodinium pilosum]
RSFPRTTVLLVIKGSQALAVTRPVVRCARPEAYYVHMMKRLALRVDAQTAESLLMQAPKDPEKETRANKAVKSVRRRKRRPFEICLPLMDEAARLVLHTEELARTGARVTCLSLLKIDNLRVREAAMEAFNGEMLPCLVDGLQSAWAAVAAAVRGKNASALRSALSKEEDILDFVAELLKLGLPWVNKAVADSFVTGLMLPQLFVL